MGTNVLQWTLDYPDLDYPDPRLSGSRTKTINDLHMRVEQLTKKILYTWLLNQLFCQLKIVRLLDKAVYHSAPLVARPVDSSAHNFTYPAWFSYYFGQRSPVHCIQKIYPPPPPKQQQQQRIEVLLRQLTGDKHLIQCGLPVNCQHLQDQTFIVRREFNSKHTSTQYTTI